MGMVLYWMMNRHVLPFLPFPPTIPTAMQRQEAADRRFAGEAIPEPVNGSPELKRIVMKACAFLPEERYRTAEEMRADLQRCTQKQEPVKTEEVAQSAQEEPSGDYKTHSVFTSQPFSLEETVIDTSVGAASAKEEPPAPADIPQNEPVLFQFSQQEKTPRAEEKKPETKSEKQTEKQYTAPAKKQKAGKRMWLLCIPLLLCLVVLGARLVMGEITSARLSRTAFDSLLSQKSVRRVQFTDSQQGAPGNATDLSEKQDGSILGWWNGDTLTVAGRGKIYAPEDCSGMFKKCAALQKIDWGNCFDTSKVTDMNRMFADCSSLISLDVSNFNTSNVINMNWMFAGCNNLTNLNVSGFDTSNVTIMRSMFFDCSRLTNLDVSDFNTSKATDMSFMFYNCSSLTNLNVSGFNTSNKTYMHYMFAGCDPSIINWGNFDRHGWTQARLFGT